MTNDFLTVLAHEFSAGEGSFLEQMYKLTWDKAAFTRLTEAMFACCQAFDAHERRPTGVDDGLDTTPVPRWLADGYWYVSADVRHFTLHPAWKSTTALEQGYYDAAYERLYLLAYWFFTGGATCWPQKWSEHGHVAAA
jgi:hypothetical protein